MLRYERKFVEEKRSYEEVKNWILTHPHFFSPQYFPREVNNIYFDTPGFDFYRDNVEGEMNRKKIRIRWYGNREDPQPTVALEYKIKRGLLGTKKTYHLHDFLGAGTWTSRKLFTWLQEQYLPFPILQELKNLRPVLLNHYSREYFSNKDQSIRITLDKNLRYQPFPPFQSMSNSLRHKRESVIMEIKYPPQLEEQMQYTVQHFPFRLSKSSKYVEGLQTIFMV
jgi:SPX domain protein involved in polyphosphate accumulation